MSHYYDKTNTSDIFTKQRNSGEQSLPKIKTFDKNKLIANSQRNNESLDVVANGKFFEYDSSKRIQKSSNVYLSKKFGERGGSLVANTANNRSDFISPDISPKKDLDGYPM